MNTISAKSISTCRATSSSFLPVCPGRASRAAFDTIYAEGQRRYVESLSAYARQFLGQMDKPDVDFIEGLSPISIDQKSASRNPRSTVGTVTEVYDYLRLLFARIGIPHDPETGEELVRQTPQQIVDKILTMEEDCDSRSLLRSSKAARAPTTPCSLTSPVRGSSEPSSTGSSSISTRGELELERYETHDISVVVDRLVLREGIERRLTDSIETALNLTGGIAELQIVPKEGEPRRSFSANTCRARATASRSMSSRREFLLQLAVRRLLTLRWSRHRVRGSMLGS